MMTVITMIWYIFIYNSEKDKVMQLTLQIEDLQRKNLYLQQELQDTTDVPL
jgi:hypothetical protein